MAKKYVMKPSLKTVVVILESLMTSQAIEGTWIRTGGYGWFRGEWVNEKFYAVVLQKCGQKFDSCAELLLLLLLLLVIKLQ